MDRRVVPVLAAVALLVGAGLLAAGGGFAGVVSDGDEDGAERGDDGSIAGGGEHARACVALLDGETGETVARVDAAVADTRDEQHQGLSGTASLANGSGMLFVFEEEAERTFVMREMNYPIDMVFVGADRRITRVFHAPVEDDGSLTEYSASAKWVLEVPYEWTTRQGVTAGDEIRVEYGCGDPSIET